MNGSERLYADWIGRTEIRHDVMTAGPNERLSATLDRADPPLKEGDVVPPMAHWLTFLPDAQQSDIGADGHPRRGGFLPPVDDLPRRMWAGSRVSFPGDLRVGMALERRSTIASIEEKQGGSGRLVFVTVRHEIGEADTPALVVDEHDIVFRGLGGAAVRDARPAGPAGVWTREVKPDIVMLFRYSALTFNSHRIHYDPDYVTKEEGYPGLVVHGPLIATLLLDLVRRFAPADRVDKVSFTARSPLFEGSPILLNGEPSPDGRTVVLWATNPGGGLAMKAEATLA